MSSHRRATSDPRHRPARQRRGAGRHRAPAPARRRYITAVATAALGAGVVVLGSAASAPLHHPAAAATLRMTAQLPLSTGWAAATDGGSDGLALRHGLGAPPPTPSVAPPVRASRAKPRAALPAFALPTHGRLTTCFCWRWGAFHDGIDLAAPMLTPIYAAADGVVTTAGPNSGYGNLIVITHAGKTITFYGHEEKILVRVGQHVRAGQRIALVGSRGFSTGPHLHFGVRTNGVGLDPIPWLRRHGVKI